MNGSAIVLAAGSSTRFGSDKRRQIIDGQTMVYRCVSQMLCTLSHVIVVVQPEDDIQESLPEQAQVVEAKQAHLGMGHSLAAGIQAIERHTAWVLVALADMPWLTRSTVDTVINRITTLDHGIVRPSYKGKQGHPVGFTQNYYAQLAGLTGDLGARDLIRSEKSNLHLCPVEDPGVLTDVDRPDQLKGYV